MEMRYIKEAENIMDFYPAFLFEGVRMIMLANRKKDTGEKSNNERYNIRYLVNGREEFAEKLALFLRKKSLDSEFKDHRIYSSVNSRNMAKAIRLFKQRQLDADYFGKEEQESFFLDIKNRFISAAMNPSSRNEKNFLIDIDEGEDVHDCMKKLLQITRNNFRYATKNGHHIICQPFNPKLLPGYEIKKDGLVLIKY